jgi:hypothetical protein
MSQKTLDSLLELKIKESMFQRKAIRVKSKIGTLRLRHKVEKLKKQDEKKNLGSSGPQKNGPATICPG